MSANLTIPLRRNGQRFARPETSRMEQRTSSNLEDCLLQPFNLAGFHSALGPSPQFLQLPFVVLDAPLQLRNVVPRVPIPPVKHVTHADKTVPLALQVLQHSVIPCLCLVLQQRLARCKMLRCSSDTCVYQRHIVRVHCVGILRDLSQRLQCQGKPQMVCGKSLIALSQAFQQVTEINIDLRRALYARSDSIEKLVEIGRQGVFEIRRKNPSCEFLLDRYRRLLTPYRKFL